MEIIQKKVDELVPYGNNPRINDDAVPYVANSIKEFGFKVPIVIDKNNIIITGHTRLKAAKQLGLKEVPCIIVDELTDEQIKGFRIIDNKISEYSYWNNEKLESELKEISENYDLILFGIDNITAREEIENIDLNDFFETLEDDEESEIEETKEVKEKEHICPHCNAHIKESEMIKYVENNQ